MPRFLQSMAVVRRFLHLVALGWGGYVRGDFDLLHKYRYNKLAKPCFRVLNPIVMSVAIREYEK